MTDFPAGSQSGSAGLSAASVETLPVSAITDITKGSSSGGYLEFYFTK